MNSPCKEQISDEMQLVVAIKREEEEKKNENKASSLAGESRCQDKNKVSSRGAVKKGNFALVSKKTSRDKDG